MYNEHTNAYFKCNKILKLSDQHELQIPNYIFQFLHSNIDEAMESSLLLIIKFIVKYMSIWRVNRYKTK